MCTAFVQLLKHFQAALPGLCFAERLVHFFKRSDGPAPGSGTGLGTGSGTGQRDALLDIEEFALALREVLGVPEHEMSDDDIEAIFVQVCGEGEPMMNVASLEAFLSAGGDSKNYRGTFVDCDPCLRKMDGRSHIRRHTLLPHTPLCFFSRATFAIAHPFLLLLNLSLSLSLFQLLHGDPNLEH